VRVLARNGKGNSRTVAAGIIWAVDHGAGVINLSLGAGRSTLAIQRAVDYAARHDVVVVAAAGNQGSSRRFYPAASQSVIAVAATDRADRLYPWSNRGDWVDIAAPGCNVAPWRGGSYATFCGTSAAAPLVAGLAALVRSAFPKASAAETARLLGSKRLDATRAFRTSRPPLRPRLTEVMRSVRP
jgi:subtilisin family serine protease